MSMSLSMPLGRRSLLATAIALPTLARAQTPPAQRPPAQAAGLELVATFTNPRQVTGVAVSPKGRVFVNFPRWEEDVAISVGEVGPDGALKPYPDVAWNSFRNAGPDANPAKTFVSVQSVTIDPLGNLWVLDAAAPNLGFEVRNGPKLVRIDLNTNTVARVYAFDTKLAPQGTYLNDVRFTPDGKRAVLTNSGAPGSLITLDVATGEARRVLDGHPSTQFEKTTEIVVNGTKLQRPDGERPLLSADGIAIDNRGQYVMWQATTGATMYRVPVAALFDTRISPVRLGSMVEMVTKTFVADGYWMGRDDVLYVTSCSDNSVKRMGNDKNFTVVAHDPRLLWPDSMAQGPDGMLYVTASHIPEMKAWQGPGVAQSELFRFKAS